MLLKDGCVITVISSCKDIDLSKGPAPYAYGCCRMPSCSFELKIFSLHKVGKLTLTHVITSTAGAYVRF